MKKEKWYAIYKGDTFIVQGTKKECAEYLGVKETTIKFMTTPTYKKRLVKEDNNRLLAIKVGD